MKKSFFRRMLAYVLAVAMVVSTLTVYGADYETHQTRMYIVSASTGKVVAVDKNNLQLIANVDLPSDVSTLDNNCLFYTTACSDNRFPGYKAIMSAYNSQSVSARTAGEGGLIANGGTSTSGWEVMRFEKVSNDTFVIRTANGYSNNVEQGAFVVLDENNYLVPGSTDMSKAERFYIVGPEGMELPIYSNEPATTVPQTTEEPTSAITEVEKNQKDNVANVNAGLNIARDGKNLTLTWNSIDGASSYQIYRSTGQRSKYQAISTTNGNTFTERVQGSVYQYYYKIAAVDASDEIFAMSEEMGMDYKLFGKTMTIVSPTDDKDTINNDLKAISDKMMKATQAEFTDDRFAVLFKPGQYDIKTINVGFYTQVLGLGKNPHDVTIKNINVDSAANGNVLINFWRGIENLSVDTGNPKTEVKWGASQAAPIRRLYVNGKLHLDDIGLPASGGYTADTYVTGETGSWSQQQFYLRNNNMTSGWYDGCWNIVFQGCTNSPASSEDWANTGYHGWTNVATTERIREKPFLYLDDAGEYQVFVPGLRNSAVGTSWDENNMGVGKSISIDNFYVAQASVDTADTINQAVEAGKNLIFTPGVYRVNKPINITRKDTVVLGLGLATIICENTDAVIKVADVDGVTIAGLILEAGANESKSLIEVGSEKTATNHSKNPILLSDVFCRVGGARVGKTKATVIINANDVIGDHFWLWRADHGAGANWTQSTADNGLVVNGDNVNIYGLFVEHFQKNQTLWNGENGNVYFYQCELPYDVPYQTDWMSNNGATKGYAAYKVADAVKKHQVTGLGIYEVFVHTNEYITLDNAMEVSEGTVVKNACTVSLGNVNGEITHIVNGNGPSVGSGISTQGLKYGINYYPVDAKTSDDILADKMSRTDKKGVSSWYYASGNNKNQRNLGLFNNIGASWTYNWGATVDVATEAVEAGLEYVPMVWGAGSVNANEIAKLKEGKEKGYFKNLLAFNEPDLPDQSNMSVDKAIELWPQLEETGLRLGSPAGAAVEDDWVDRFMKKANELGYRVDFITLHVYQDFTNPGSVKSLKSALERLHNKYNLPIWITEIGNVDVSTQWAGYNLYSPMSHDNACTYITDVCNMLESLDYVERYAWFVDYSSNISGTAYTRLFDITDDSLTPEGEAYAKIKPAEVKPEPPTTQPTTQAPTTKPQATTVKPTTAQDTSASQTTAVDTTNQTEITTVDSVVDGKVKTPKRVTVKKVSVVKKKSLKIKLKKVANVKGYRIQISTTKKFKKKTTKSLYSKKATKVVKKFKGGKKFAKGKKYFVRAKAYIVVNGKKVFSLKWSKIKKVKFA